MPITTKGKTIHIICRRCQMPRSIIDDEKLKCHADGKLTYKNSRGKNIKYQHIWLY